MPDASKEEKAEILAKMMGKSKVQDGQELLEAVSKLDQSEKQHFKPLVNACVDQIEEDIAKEKLNKKPKDKEKDIEIEKDQEAPNAAPSANAAEAAEPEELPDARSKKSVIDRAAPKAVASKKPAPHEIKELFPDVPGIYIKWLNRDRRLTIEFTSLQGKGCQRTKTASWPHYCGLPPKEEAVYKCLKFTELCVQKHFKDVDPSWKMPSRDRIHTAVAALVERLSEAPNWAH